MINNRVVSWNLVSVFIASITTGIVAAHIYTSYSFNKNDNNKRQDSPDKTQVADSKPNENKPQTTDKHNSTLTTESSSNNSNSNSEANNNIYQNKFSEGEQYLKNASNQFSQINENLPPQTGTKILNEISVNINNSQKSLKQIPPESHYYSIAQEYLKRGKEYEKATLEWQKYFESKDKKFATKTYPNLTIKNKSIFLNSMKPKSIALTFDDGPTNDYTVKILDILKKHNIKATFFVVGKRVKENCPVLQRIYQEGHEIGNHSYTHPYLTKISVAEQKQEITNTQTIINQCVPYYQPQWFRAPYADQNTALLNTVHSLGLNTAQWTIDTNDWRKSSTTNTIIQQAISVNNSAVILMHDGANVNPNFPHPEESLTRDNTVKSIEEIVVNLKKRGFNFVTLSEAMN